MLHHHWPRWARDDDSEDGGEPLWREVRAQAIDVQAYLARIGVDDDAKCAIYCSAGWEAAPKVLLVLQDRAFCEASRFRTHGNASPLC